MIVDLPVEAVNPNVAQPRKRFDQKQLLELSASIQRNGLLQPIIVRINGNGYTIVAGERRWRAHVINGAATIRAQIVDIDDNTMSEQAIVENLQRVDLTPLEEGRAYKTMLDRGYSQEGLADRLGLSQPWRIRERLRLLNLRTEYQALLEAKQITQVQASELSRLAPADQDRVFRLIKSGNASRWSDLRAATEALLHQQTSLDSLPQPTEKERRAVSDLEKVIEKAGAILAKGFNKGEVSICRRIRPDKAEKMAEEIKLIRVHLDQLETALRTSAIQGTLLSDKAA